MGFGRLERLLELAEVLLCLTTPKLSILMEVFLDLCSCQDLLPQSTV